MKALTGQKYLNMPFRLNFIEIYQHLSTSQYFFEIYIHLSYFSSRSRQLLTLDIFLSRSRSTSTSRRHLDNNIRDLGQYSHLEMSSNVERGVFFFFSIIVNISSLEFPILPRFERTWPSLRVPLASAGYRLIDEQGRAALKIVTRKALLSAIPPLSCLLRSWLPPHR
jgi:hypothetical protein